MTGRSDPGSRVREGPPEKISEQLLNGKQKMKDRQVSPTVPWEMGNGKWERLWRDPAEDSC